jgi:hypothetical protein
MTTSSFLRACFDVFFHEAILDDEIDIPKIRFLWPINNSFSGLDRLQYRGRGKIICEAYDRNLFQSSIFFNYFSNRKQFESKPADTWIVRQQSTFLPMVCRAVPRIFALIHLQNRCHCTRNKAADWAKNLGAEVVIEESVIIKSATVSTYTLMMNHRDGHHIDVLSKVDRVNFEVEQLIIVKFPPETRARLSTVKRSQTTSTSST